MNNKEIAVIMLIDSLDKAIHELNLIRSIDIGVLRKDSVSMKTRLNLIRIKAQRISNLTDRIDKRLKRDR